MSFRCRDFERLLCDYLDETLSRDERRDFDEHLLQCKECAETLSETAFAADVLRHEPGVEPPPELVASILDETIGYRAGAGALAGGGDAPSGWFGWFKPLLNPFTQPRFVMSMAMTALSFSMLTYYGQRAVEAWRDPEPTPGLAAVQQFRDDLSDVWAEAVEMFEAAQAFYELQTTTTPASSEDEAEAGGER